MLTSLNNGAYPIFVKKMNEEHIAVDVLQLSSSNTDTRL